MQALETIKILVQKAGSSLTGCQELGYQPTMTLFAAFDHPQWRTFRLRPKRGTCIVCGPHPSITRETIKNSSYDSICGRIIPTEINQRVSAQVDIVKTSFLTSGLP
jgi:adenylyltransferase and sulfurtransferase